MTAHTLFYITIAILIINFLVDFWLNYKNAKQFTAKIPDGLHDVYDEAAYNKSQQYKYENYKFNCYTSIFYAVLTLSFFLFEGFRHVNDFANQISDNPILVGLVFFAIIILGSDLLSIPFGYYKTFIIEERFDFNKTTKRTFWADKLKSALMTVVLGGFILAVVMWFYKWVGERFWIYAWLILIVFSIVMTMFYSRVIVPLFNKQTPLENGDLRVAISNYAAKVGFNIDAIFVIDGSKRTTKANAYFTGFGTVKRIVLYDTLITNYTNEEIVAILAHEIGHYKQRHIVYNLLASIVLTGFTLYVFSLFVNYPLLSQSLGIKTHSFHVSLLVFGVLYTPISQVTSLLINAMSRRFEYQADNYAKQTYKSQALITALKKLSKQSLSNLTPHPAYVFAHYSHPTLYQRIKNLNR